MIWSSLALQHNCLRCFSLLMLKSVTSLRWNCCACFDLCLILHGVFTCVLSAGSIVPQDLSRPRPYLFLVLLSPCPVFPSSPVDQLYKAYYGRRTDHIVQSIQHLPEYFGERLGSACSQRILYLYQGDVCC